LLLGKGGGRPDQAKGKKKRKGEKEFKERGRERGGKPPYPRETGGLYRQVACRNIKRLTKKEKRGKAGPTYEREGRSVAWQKKKVRRGPASYL